MFISRYIPLTIVSYEVLFIIIEGVRASFPVLPTGADETTFDSRSYEQFSGSQ